MVVLILFALLGLVFVVVLALVVVAIAIGTQRAADRRQGLAAYAHHREWEYVAEDGALVHRFAGAPFGRGHSQRALNVLRGRSEGRAFTAFDYHWATGGGEDRRSHSNSVVALHLGVVAPELAVGPTTTLRRWVDGLTGRDIAIGDPQFDDHFTVHSPSPEFARDLLLSDVRDVMRHHAAMSWRITGDSILVIRPGAHSPGDVETTLAAMNALLDRVPDHVWGRLGGSQPR